MKESDKEKEEIEIAVIDFWTFFQVNKINQRSDYEDN